MDHLTRGGGPESSLVEMPAATKPRMTADQEKLASRVERHVRRQTNDKVRQLRVEVRAGCIFLHGRCGTFYSKQLAQTAAMSLGFEGPLINQIEVW